MAAWGIRTFDNDDASDGLYDLEESDDLSVVEEAFEFEKAYVEAPECPNALAAAEIVLALLGKACIGLPENTLTWVKHEKVGQNYR